VVPTVRRVSFDWSNTPLHWVKADDPFPGHLINVFHMLLPPLERWFIHDYRQILPRITDELLREQVRAFMGQEGVHAVAHTTALDHLQAQGVDCTAYIQRVEHVFSQILSDDTAPRALRNRWLEARIAAIAGLEHFTAVLGQWLLDAKELDAVGADPVMLDLLRWHGAEEVEHRAVAFDTYRHISGSYPLRQTVMMTLVFPSFMKLLIDGAAFLMLADPTVDEPTKRRYRGRPRDVQVLREWRRAAKHGLLPRPKLLFGAIPEFLNPKYHPIEHGSTAQAEADLARSPAAQAGYGPPAEPTPDRPAHHALHIPGESHEP
jgi:predicted metal-dependent hydrolase